MRLFAPIGTHDLVCLYWPLGPHCPTHVLGNAHGFDTDEKWVEVYVFSPFRTSEGKPRIMTADGRLVTARLHINFEIVDKYTGEVICSVRQ